jgi:hypothetical protein
MDGTHFYLDTEKRTLLAAVARIVIIIMTFILLLPTLLISLVLTIITALIPEKYHRIIFAPIDRIWRALLWLLIKTSKIWTEKPFLRLPLLIVGVPLAVIAYAFIGCLPPLPNAQAKNSRLALCDQWPLTWSMWNQLDRQPTAKSHILSSLPDFYPPRW